MAEIFGIIFSIVLIILEAETWGNWELKYKAHPNGTYVVFVLKVCFPISFLKIYKWQHCTTCRECCLNLPEHNVILLLSHKVSFTTINFLNWSW